MFGRRVKVDVTGLTATTRGLARRGHPELRIEVDEPARLGEAKAFLEFVVAYLEESKRRIRAGETLRYGYWLVKFVTADETERELDVWEYDADATKFIRGGALMIRYWAEQQAICGRYHAAFAPPDPEALTAVSRGVLEGRPAQGMRYPWPESFSGWLIVSDEYDGDVETLQRHHTYHVTSARPDLARYVALPPGYGFDARNGERVWFDEQALREHLAEFAKGKS